MQREVDELAGGVLAREACFVLIALRSWRLSASIAVRIRYERRQMPPRSATGPLQLLSASGSVSTVRPSGMRGIRRQTQVG